MPAQESLLTQRVRGRHEKALSDFVSSLRELHAEYDQQVAASMGSLRLFLSQSSAERMALVSSHQDGLDSFRETVADVASRFSSGAECPLLDDDLHTMGEDSLSSRSKIIEDKKDEVILIAQECFRIHNDNMQSISDGFRTMRQLEASRLDATKSRLDALGAALAAAAFVNEVDLQVIVQRATHSVNTVLLQNQTNLNDTISQMRQSEILSTRECLCSVADLYNDQLDVMRDSMILWTLQYLSGATFHLPGHRQELLRQLGRQASKIKEEVQQSLRGLSALAETLTTVRSDGHGSEACGGTAQNGWLRFYDIDFHRPLYIQPPQQIVTEWEAFLGVIVRNARCSSLEILESFASAENALVRESERVLSVATDQIRQLFVLSDSQRSSILRCCLSDHFTFPLNTIRDRVDFSDLAISELSVLTTSVIDAIKSKGQKFLSLVAESTNRRSEDLADALVTNCNSVLSYVSETTSELETASLRSLSKIRGFYLEQENRTKDFEDATQRLEKTMSSIVASLQRAGSVADADVLFAKGMVVLGHLQESYHSFHNDCVGPMEGLGSDISSSLADNKARILGIVRAAISEDTQRSFVGVDGLSYSVVSTEWRFPSQVPPPPPLEIVAPPEVVVQPKKGKAPTKKVREPEPEIVTEIAPVIEAPPASDPEADAFQSEIDVVLTPECLISPDSIHGFLSTLQISLAKWVVALEFNAVKSFSEFCRRRRDALNSRVNELIRRHQRRAPSLQSGVFELRIRELQSSHQGRQRQMESFEHRLGAMAKMMDALMDDSRDMAEENAVQLDLATQEVLGFVTRQVLETHDRAFADLIQKMREAMAARRIAIRRQLQSSVDSIVADCESFKANGMRTFEQGGSITEVEKREALKAVGEFLERLSTAEEDIRERIDVRISEERGVLDEAAQRHDESSVQCRRELDFFASISTVLSELKGKVYNIIMANENSNSRLNSLIDSLEEAVRGREEGERFHLSFGACVAAAKTAGSNEVINGSLDECLSLKLRQTQADASLLLQESRPHRILEAMLALRLPLLNRGAVLDGLHHTVDLYQLSQDLLVDPTESVTEILLTPPVRIQQQQPKKKAMGMKDTKAAAAPPPAFPTTQIFVSPEGFIDSLTDPLVIPSTLAADMEVLCREAQCTIDSLIRDHLSHSVVLRGHVLGGTSFSELAKSSSERIHVHRRRIADYCEDGVLKYREQVQRVLIIVSDASEEMFRSLQSVCSKSLAMRLEDVLSTFFTFYNPMVASRVAHDHRLKGCLSAPSNRSALSSLVNDEARRQDEVQRAIKTLWAIALREIQFESKRTTMRCLLTLQSFFWLVRGLVSPDHLIAGGAAALGEHKSLRRLLKKGERAAQSADAAVSVVVADSKSTAGSASGAKGDKIGEKNKKSVAKEIEPVQQTEELVPLNIPLCDFSGVDPDRLRMFDQFVAQSSETAKSLVNHYLLPSQWSVPTVTEAPPPEVVKRDVKGKKGAIIAVEEPQATPLQVCAHHRAPSNPICQSAYFSRERTIEMLRNAMQHAANDATKFFAGLLLEERQWSHSWDDAVSRL